MAKARAQFSVWFTVVLTVATVVVVVGILLAPRVLSCQAGGGSLGSCIHDRLTSLVGDDAPSSPPLVASSGPSEAQSVPGIDTSSASVAIATPPAVALAPADGTLEAGSAAQPAPAPPEVALASPPGQLDAGTAASGETAASAVDLVPPTGTLSATAAPPATPSASGQATITSPTGVLTAAVADEPAPSVATLAEPHPLPTGDTGWSSVWRPTATVAAVAPPALDKSQLGGSSAAGAPISASSTLTAPAPKAPAPKPTPAPSRRTVSPAPTPAAAAPRPAASPVTPSPRRTPKADPRYPNVVVLPTPRGPSDSSFATLKVR